MKWNRLVKEASDGKDYIYIDTGLLAGSHATEILDSVIGQMSDGMWENSPQMEHYWPFMEAVESGGRAMLKVFAGMYDPREGTVNYFKKNMNLDENKILQFMGKKVKEVAKEELKDFPKLGEWKRDNESASIYLSHSNKVTFQEVYFTYETLIGRSGYEKKYPMDVADALKG